MGGSAARSRLRARCRRRRAAARFVPSATASSSLVRPSQATSESSSRSDSLRDAKARASSLGGSSAVRRRRRARVRRQPLAQGAAPALASALVRDHAAGDPVEPRPQLVALGTAVEAPPQRGERLRDHLGRVLRLAHAPQRVAAERRVQLAVRRFESLAASVVGHRTILHNRNMSGCGPSVSGTQEEGPGNAGPSARARAQLFQPGSGGGAPPWPPGGPITWNELSRWTSTLLPSDFVTVTS